MTENNKEHNGKYKVLQFPLSSSFGGVTHYVLNLWKGIDKNKFQFDFLTFSKVLTFEKDLLQMGCNVYHAPCYPQEDEKQFDIFFEEVLHKGYDLIELHTTYWKNIHMEKVIREVCGSKIIIHAHCCDIVPKPLDDEIYKMSLLQHYKVREGLSVNFVDKCLACSQDAADWLFDKSMIGHNCNIINNFINISEYQFDCSIREKKRKEINVRNEFVIGIVARLEKEKNHSFAIELVYELKKNIQNIRLLVIGDGTQRDKINKLIKQKNVQDNVIMVGERIDIKDWLCAMDLFILPSEKEAFGISLIEAQASGLPCVCSTGIPENVINSDYSRRFELHDMQQWSEYIVYYIENSWKDNSRESMLDEKKFDSRFVISKIEKIYEDLINN